MAFSPDGRLIATGHYDGTAQLWSTESWKPVGRPLEGHDDKRVLWIGFTRDGTTLATAGQDGTIELVDVATPDAGSGSPLSVEPDSYVAAALSPDGSRLFAVSREPRRRPLEHRARGLEAARLPRRGTRAHTARVGGRPARPAVPLDLPPGLTTPTVRRAMTWRRQRPRP